MGSISWSFSLYFLVVLGIAAAAWSRTQTVSDFVLARRRLGPVVTALSAGASDMSGWLLLGLPGAIYASGMGEAWIVVGLLCGALVNWTVIAPRLRRATAAYRESTDTLSGFFRVRLADDTRALELVTSLVILVFFTIYVAAGFIAGAKLAQYVLGFGYLESLIIGSFLIGLYTVFGGFIAASWTDAFQATLMLLALILVPALAIAGLGSEITISWTLPTESLTTIGLVSALAWGLGYFGQPHILARFMAIKRTQLVPSAALMGMTWMIFVSIGAVAVGMSGAALLPGLEDSEKIFIHLSEAVLHPWVAGIVIAAILAAVMSTVDSQLIVASSSIIDLFGPRGTKGLQLSRFVVVSVTLIAFLIALDSDSTVLGVVSYAWAGLGGCLGPAVLFCLFWRRTTALSLLLGMIAGGCTVFVWNMQSGGVFDLYEIVPAFLATVLVTMIVALIHPSTEAENQYAHLKITAAL